MTRCPICHHPTNHLRRDRLGAVIIGSCTGIRTRRARQTGTEVTVGRASALGVDDAGGAWAAICEDHGSILNTATRALADRHAADPAGWCEACREEVAS